ncbi:MAG: hypothetical protein HY062_01735 [Bacteroidetes bacterium]|nr:hypothetical protein [Bacteroidota bacterium]
MSNKSKNKYVQQARQKTLMGTKDSAAVETKHDFKKTAAYTGRDILFGGIAGSLAGAVVGRSSLLVGIAITGAGHYFGSPSAAVFGVGMMASGGYQTVSAAMNGTEKEGIEGIKERFSNFKDNLKRQLFLDKIMKKKKAKEKTEEEEEGTNGMGNVQYFKHPGGEDVSGLDFTEANRIEQQIEESGKKFAQMNGMDGDFSGTEDDVNGTEDDVNGLEGEIEDRIM